ncbi:ACT domain-containing protein [Streptomonospora litoralis]|uniref:ACT domain protein n=1 Tax=Streptomonospora litoralis TaxID=2498135 RepID=A0A4V0ZJR7_9ACTN|nr:ACT domain-containing protein [Streptomonospora litoralis]QBI54422.1 ACT domain protein [Streptomonospora litoralis]
MHTPERDLDRMLAGLRPELRSGTYVFARAAAPPAGVDPAVTVAEDEGLTVVCTREEAEAAGLVYDFAAAWITLRVHSALDAVGLTAAVSAALARAAIPCNIVAGFHHDHVFVPADESERALDVLRTLSAEAAAGGTDDAAVADGCR